MSPVAVFAVVIIGTALAGIAGAIFAIPTAAAILAITDYLRDRDVLLRSSSDTVSSRAIRWMVQPYSATSLACAR